RTAGGTPARATRRPPPTAAGNPRPAPARPHPPVRRSAGRIGRVSLHLGAAYGEIAPRVLLPGDPVRAEWIAQTYLADARCYSRVRNTLGYTGLYRRVLVSVHC